MTYASFMMQVDNLNCINVLSQSTTAVVNLLRCYGPPMVFRLNYYMTKF